MRLDTNTLNRNPVTQLCFVLVGCALLLASACDREPPRRLEKRYMPTVTQQPTKKPTQKLGNPQLPDPASIPLKPTGIGSAASLTDDNKKLTDPRLKRLYEIAFRQTFSSQKNKRNYKQASQIFRFIIKKAPKFAPAYRGLGYAIFSQSLNFNGAERLYTQAVTVDPSHGESHYALAFILGAQLAAAKRQGKVELARKIFDRGLKHIDLAVKLGAPDERGIKARFFSKRP